MRCSLGNKLLDPKSIHQIEKYCHFNWHSLLLRHEEMGGKMLEWAWKLNNCWCGRTSSRSVMNCLDLRWSIPTYTHIHTHTQVFRLKMQTHFATFPVQVEANVCYNQVPRSDLGALEPRKVSPVCNVPALHKAGFLCLPLFFRTQR